MQLPTTSYHHGYGCDRRGSSTDVKSYLFTTHPGMGGENLSLYAPYRALFCHRPPSRKDTAKTVPHDLEDSALSTHPQPDLHFCHRLPTIGQQGEKGDVAQDSGSFHRLVPYVAMMSRDGRPFLGHVAIATSTRIDKTLTQDTPSIPASSYPIKGQARALQEARNKTRSQAQTSKGKRTTNRRPRKTNLPCILIFPLIPRLGSLSHSL
jgi:hypothetical protein